MRTRPDGSSPARALLPLIGPIYAPTVLESAGETALLPVVPLLALDLGFSPAGAAALTMIAGAAAVLGPIPTGRLMGAIGARPAIIGSGLLLAAANLAAIAVIGGGPDDGAGPGRRLALIGLLVIMAATSQVWQLGRQAYLGAELPPGLRARGTTAFGGMLRIGQVIGPLLGAGVMALGHETWVFGLFAVMMIAATAMVTIFMVPGEKGRGSGEAMGARAERVAGTTAPGATTPGAAAPGDAAPRSRAVLARMVRVGAGVTPIMMGRINRPVIVPLIGASLSLDATTISLVFGIAAVVEIVLFVPAGAIMDRWGRAAVAVPCSLLMGIGYVLLAVLVPMFGTRSPTSGFLVLALPCLLIALGNGLGAGIVMTLGIDVSPERDRTRYLSWWNTVIGIGRLGAPLLVSAIALVAPVAVASAGSGMLCLAGAGWLARVLPEVSPAGSQEPEDAR